jgi:hypothetical protein
MSFDLLAERYPSLRRVCMHPMARHDRLIRGPQDFGFELEGPAFARVTDDGVHPALHPFAGVPVVFGLLSKAGANRRAPFFATLPCEVRCECRGSNCSADQLDCGIAERRPVVHTTECSLIRQLYDDSQSADGISGHPDRTNDTAATMPSDSDPEPSEPPESSNLDTGGWRDRLSGFSASNHIMVSYPACGIAHRRAGPMAIIRIPSGVMVYLNTLQPQNEFARDAGSAGARDSERCRWQMILRSACFPQTDYDVVRSTGAAAAPCHEAKRGALCECARRGRSVNPRSGDRS